MGYLKSIGTTIIYIGAFAALVTFIPGLPPDATFSEYSIQTPKELPGELALNERLNNAEVLFKGKLQGAEAFASYNGELYTGVIGGYIMKVTKDKLVPIVKLGKKCDLYLDSKCGKPLGMKFDKKGALYVCDSSNGIFKVDVKTGKYETLVKSNDLIEGKKAMIFNSLDIASNGDIYWSHSSTEVPIDDLITAMMANPSGRLIRYNAATKKNQVLLKDLGFANGVHLSEDEQFVIVAESLTSRIKKYYIKGPKAGKSEIFVQALPGVPDNIHSDGKNGFIVGLYFYADSQNPQLFQSIIPHPLIRKMVARLITLYKMPFKLLRQYYPEYANKAFAYFPGVYDPNIMSPPQIKCVLRIDSSGKIIDAAYSTDDKFTEMSSAYIHDGYLWIGSPHSDQIIRVPLKQAFPSLVGIEKKSSSENKATTSEKKESVPVKKNSIPEEKAPDTKKASTPEKKPVSSEKKPSTEDKKSSSQKKQGSVPEKKTGKTVKKDAPK